MADSKKDYYDLPTEWIPSSNFANRPASEISDINSMDGLRTFVCSSESSPASSETEECLTPVVQDATKPSLSELDAPTGPLIVVSGPTNDVPRLRQRSFSNDVELLERPSLRKKADTAPPGALSLPDYAPQLPRRAISTRLDPSKSEKGCMPQQTSRVTDPSVFRGASGDRQGPKARLPPIPQPATQSDNSKSLGAAQPLGSFSQRARVRKTLDDRNVGRLNTNIVESISRPNSMLKTPRELYAIPEKNIPQQEPSSPSSPHAMYARKSIMSSLAGSSSTLRLSRASRPQPTDEYINAGRQPVYTPGAVCLEQHPAKLRKDSVASLDPFAKDIEPRGKRYSDMIVLDSVVIYFADFGIMEDETECCIDRFWLDACRVPCRVVHTPRSPSITSVDPPLKSLETSQSEQSRQGSQFSFSSASSSMTQPRSGTPIRQRDKIRRLLSPAFSSSAF
ncbi:hypothetical protein BDU57DRAFT_459097 [Ampelomyces quisqualis]|uniref:Uncharacterized protein n=1 Tax=Ampelomyces quisqualis TaxID=50730 RepID=A0A6A5QA76_AMPQU|nr:hypothetical protein BDU57DRAFT_459097 [Ampelomyces quisqualis]